MLLKSLTLHNFRQYKEDQKINFSTDQDKNVTVILGKNTSGKTTLIQAFYWVLYGKTNFDTSDFLLNLEVANALELNDGAYCKVILELEHDEVEYTIVRKQEYRRVYSGEVKPYNSIVTVNYKLPNGQTKQEKNAIEAINKILPEKLSDYFFFDGERIGDLASNDLSGRRDIASAVKGVLGLNVLDTAITHLSGGNKISVIGKLKNSIDTSGDRQLEQKKNTINQLRNKLEKSNKLVEDYDKTIDYYTQKIEKIEQIIRDNKDTKDLKRRMDSNEAEININERHKEKKAAEMIRDFSNNAPMFFMKPLLYRTINTIEDFDILDEGIPEMHSDAVDFLIKRGRCLCGAKIEHGNEAYNNLVKQKNYLPPQTIGTMLRVFMTSARHFNDNAGNFYDSFVERYKDFRTYRNKVSELSSINETLSEQIEDKPDIGKYEAEVRSLKSKLNKLRRDKENKIKDQAIYSNDITRLEREMENLASTSEKNKFILDCIKYAEYINETLNTHYSARESVIRKNLQKRVNEIFQKMYHGKRGIEIDDRYEYKLITPGFDEEVDESTGLETVTSFAFISGIVSLAKEKMENGTEIVESETYPLVMDAPFSNADEIHVERVSKILPDVAEQVIMFIMHKDWKYAEEVLGTKLEKLYELDKQSETHTIIR